MLVAAAPGAIVGNVASVAADFVSRRMIAAGGAFGLALSLVLFAAGDSFITLAFASLLGGAAATAMVDGCEVALVDVAGDDLQPALARSNLFGVAGDVLGPLALIASAGLGWSWRVPFAIAAVITSAYGLWLISLPFPAPHHDATERSVRAAARAFGDVARDRRVWALALLAMLVGPLDEPLLAFVIAFLEQVRGLSSVAAITMALVSVSGGVVAFTIGARIARRHSDRLVVTSSALVLGGSIIVIALVPALAVVAVAGFAVGVALSLIWLALQHRILTLRPGRAGTTMAVVTTVEFLGFGLAIAIGAISDRYGLTAGLIALSLLPFAVVLIAAASLPGRELSARQEEHIPRS